MPLSLIVLKSTGKNMRMTFYTSSACFLLFIFSLYKYCYKFSLHLFRYFKHRLRTLQSVCPERDYGNVCPACPYVSFEELFSFIKLLQDLKILPFFIRMKVCLSSRSMLCLVFHEKRVLGAVSESRCTVSKFLKTKTMWTSSSKIIQRQSSKLLKRCASYQLSASPKYIYIYKIFFMI